MRPAGAGTGVPRAFSGPGGVQGDERSDRDPGRDDQHGGAEAVRGGDPQLLAGEPIGAGVGDQHEQGEADGGSDRGAGGGDVRCDALLAVGDPRPRGDEHRGEHDAVADAEQHEAGDQRGVGAVRGHRQAEDQRAERADGERGDQGGFQATTRHQLTGERRAGDHGTEPKVAQNSNATRPRWRGCGWRAAAAARAGRDYGARWPRTRPAGAGSPTRRPGSPATPNRASGPARARTPAA
jgi:hypothetical protein